MVDRALTANQIATLVCLFHAGAFGRRSARSIYELQAIDGGAAKPVVIGALCDRGLAFKRAQRPRRRGNPVMHYGLTAAGFRAAKAHWLKTGKQGEGSPPPPTRALP